MPRHWRGLRPWFSGLPWRATGQIAVVGMVMTALGVTPGTSTAAGTRVVTERSAAASSPSCTVVTTPIPAEILGLTGSAFLNGYSNVSKLNGSALLGPGPGNQPKAATLDTTTTDVVSVSCNESNGFPDYFSLYEYNTGMLDYHGRSEFPPARVTFLSYGFMPTTATMQLTQVPIDCRDYTGKIITKTYDCLTTTISTNNLQNTSSYTVTAASAVIIHLTDVKVNGVPLDVGPGCRTVTPMDVTLAAHSGQPPSGPNTGVYSINFGGPLAGSAAVPRFTGCGAGENLDPILDAAISGTQNYIKLTQGPLCYQWLFPPNQFSSYQYCQTLPVPGSTYGVPNTYPIPLR